MKYEVFVARFGDQSRSREGLGSVMTANSRSPEERKAARAAAWRKWYYKKKESDPGWVKQQRIDDVLRGPEKRRSEREKYHADPRPYILARAKARAKRGNYPCSITVDDVVVPDVCPLLGVPLRISTSGRASWNSPSLDKKNPALGYVKGNVAVVSTQANVMKNMATKAQLLHFATAVITYLGSADESPST